MAIADRKTIRRRIHKRIRKKISGTTERPRLAISLSNRHVYAQVIDDSKGVTLAAASTMDKGIGSKQANVETASKVGQLIAEKAKKAQVETVIFDRGGSLYHGRVKALADAAREGGLQF